MRNFKSFLKHYRHIAVIWAVYFFFTYQLAWPSNFNQIAAWNNHEGNGHVWAFIVAFAWIVIFGLAASTYTFNQWVRFKRSGWYKK